MGLLSQHKLFFLPFVFLQVLELLKNLFRGRHIEHNLCLDKDIPRGLLQLNAMRITEILSDDTNFRSYITMHMVSSWPLPNLYQFNLSEIYNIYVDEVTLF